MTIQTFDEISDPAQGAARIAALRGRLAEIGLDGFIVPRSDEHQNEYCPPSEERLAWLTGFAGSAGVAAILEDEASIFVDGRYTVQVRDAGRHGRRHARAISSRSRSTNGSVTTLKPGQKLGYDPRLHTIAEVERLQAAAERAGATLVAVERQSRRRDLDRPSLAALGPGRAARRGPGRRERRLQARAPAREARRGQGRRPLHQRRPCRRLGLQHPRRRRRPYAPAAVLRPDAARGRADPVRRRAQAVQRGARRALDAHRHRRAVAPRGDAGKVERGQGRPARSHHGGRPFRDHRREAGGTIQKGRTRSP